MVFERVTAIIQCTKGFTDFGSPVSNYETDIFRPLFDELEQLSGRKYGSTLPAATGGTGDPPVPVGDPPTGKRGTSASPAGDGLGQDAALGSAGEGGPGTRDQGQIDLAF